MQALELPVETGDGHRCELIARIPEAPRGRVLWLAGMGMPARHYLPFADALAARGMAVFLHEWRGIGSSNLRASRASDWGYRELLADLAASQAVADAQLPGVCRILGGHSLGGQMSCCHLGLQPDSADALWLVASGAPYWRAFTAPKRWGLLPAYRFMRWLAARNGFMPGRRIGFGGNEARSVIADWARTAISGHYAAPGVDIDLESGMARFTGEVRALTYDDDWLAPPASTRFLIGKLPNARVLSAHFDDAAAGTVADHYAWIKAPDASADWLLL